MPSPSARYFRLTSFSPFASRIFTNSGSSDRASSLSADPLGISRRRWLAGLKDGSFSLPPKVPRQLLETFDGDCGCVLFRCSDCRCGCGNANCGGELERMSLASELPRWESEGEFLARISRKREQ